MANIVELKDSTSTKCYPLTKGQAVYFDDGTTATDLKNDLGVVKNELNDVNNAILTGADTVFHPFWSSGSIDASTGADSESSPSKNTRCSFFSIGATSFNVVVKSGYRAMLFYYNLNGTYKKRGGWKTSDFTYTNDSAKYRIMVSKTASNTEISIAEAYANCYITAAPQWVKDIDDEINKKNTSEYTYPPSEFTWKNNPVKGKIKNTYNGIVNVDYDVSVNDISKNGVTYYVDGDNGNDTNDGLTPETPLRMMTTAFAKSDISCMMLFGGVYLAVRNLYATTINKSIAIKGMPGENVIISTTSLTALSADPNHSGTFTGSRGNCYGVIDLSVINSDGDPTQYTQVDSTDAVYAAEGSWYIADGTVYVHTISGRTPDENLLLFRNGNNLVAEGSLTLYLENIKVYGGSSPLRATATSSSDHLKVYAKDCDFYYTYTTDNDCVMMQGVEESIFQNCRAKYSKKDGFNYHIANNIIPKAVEINCSASYCGNIDDNNDQGSTIHDGGSIIRVGCMYHDCYGSNVADNSAGSESWNVGCVAYNSLAEGSQNANFYAYDGVHMWLESCVGFGSTGNTYKYSSDTIFRIRNCRFDGSLAWSGHEPDYY